MYIPCWTFTFKINPDLNMGADEAFNQCGEPWWWFTKNGKMQGAGEPYLEGAKLKSIHKDQERLWTIEPEDQEQTY